MFITINLNVYVDIITNGLIIKKNRTDKHTSSSHLQFSSVQTKKDIRHHFLITFRFFLFSLKISLKSIVF